MSQGKENNLTVSVVIPNYNYGRFLAEAIESVLAQSYSCKEIIVVDDGSTDDSLKILEKYEDKVRVLQQKNRGVGAARNVGVENSTGDLIAFLDADDYWLPTKIEKQIECFINDEEVGLVTCGMQEFTPDGKIIGKYTEGKSGWCIKEFLLFEGVVAGPGSTSLIKKSVFEKVGGYDLRKELHPSEDWEISYRIACESKIAFVADILVNYRNHGDNGHLKIPRMERAMLLAYEKIYQSASSELEKYKRDSYGNLYSVLAGSYFHARDYPNFIRAAAKSLRYKPSKISNFLGFPIRLLQRRKNSERKQSFK